MSSPSDPRQPKTNRQIPAKPNLFNIKDAEVRGALDDLWSGWQLRNGITGNGDHAFITKAEVEAIVNKKIEPTTPVDGGTTIINGGSNVSVAQPQVTYLVRNDFAKSSISGENNGWAADITLTKSNESIVAGHFHAYSENVHYGGCWGLAVESTLTNDKNGPGIVDTQCFGAEFSCNIFHFQSQALRHAGALIVFKNRLDNEYTPKGLGGVPIPPNGTVAGSYNKNSAGIYFDSGGGRNRGSQSHLPPFTKGSPYVPCGFQTGIYFSGESLDESRNAAHDAIGIDMRAFRNPAPEGVTSGTGIGGYRQRLKAGIALCPWLLVAFDENTNGQIGMRYDDQAGMFEFVSRAKHGSDGWLGAGIQVETGFYYANYNQSGLYGAYLNLAAPGKALLKMWSHNKTRPPNAYDSTKPDSFINIDVDGGYYCIPIWVGPP